MIIKFVSIKVETGRPAGGELDVSAIFSINLSTPEGPLELEPRVRNESVSIRTFY